MREVETRAGWHRIERVLHDRGGEKLPRSVPLPPEPKRDPLTLAQRLVELAKQYDEDAREARQAAASCRAMAAELRAGMG